MSTLQKLGVLGIALAMITTVSLPGRKFEKPLKVGFDGLNNLLRTGMGFAK